MPSVLPFCRQRLACPGVEREAGQAPWAPRAPAQDPGWGWAGVSPEAQLPLWMLGPPRRLPLREEWPQGPLLPDTLTLPASFHRLWKKTLLSCQVGDFEPAQDSQPSRLRE